MTEESSRNTRDSRNNDSGHGDRREGRGGFHARQDEQRRDWNFRTGGAEVTAAGAAAAAGGDNQQGGDGAQQHQQPRQRGGGGGYRGGGDRGGGDRGGYRGGDQGGFRGGRGGGGGGGRNERRANFREDEPTPAGVAPEGAVAAEQQAPAAAGAAAAASAAPPPQRGGYGRGGGGEGGYGRGGGEGGYRRGGRGGGGGNNDGAPLVAQTGSIVRTQRAPRLRRNTFDEREVAALFEQHHNQRGITFDNYEAIQVELVPRDVEPATSFDDFQVHELLAANLKRCGYQRPTPVQKFGIPVCLSGGDLMACAQTGSGKTAAFLVPIVQHLLVYGVSPAVRGTSHPVALVLAPTRELALQIFDEARKLCYRTDIFCDVAYGGTSYPTHFENDILVACPGRLKDLFNRETVSFSKVKFLVLDEADRMLEMGFEEQIEYLVASRYTDIPKPEERQTLMFSATFPKRIRNLAQAYLRRQYYLLTVGRIGSTTKNITQRVEWVEQDDKKAKLFELLFEHLQTDLILVFVETKREAEELYHALEQEDIPCSTIHGDRRQPEREAALRDFKAGRTPILVATDVASRGLDIPDVAHVVQYDLPQSMDDYTHRIGRTGRAGNSGKATAFFNNRNTGLLEELYGYLREHEQEVPEWMDSLREEAATARAFGGGRDGGGSGPRGGRRGGGGGGGGGRFGGGDDRPHRGGGGGHGGGSRGGGGGGGQSNSRGPRVGGGGGGGGGGARPAAANYDDHGGF